MPCPAKLRLPPVVLISDFVESPSDFQVSAAARGMKAAGAATTTTTTNAVLSIGPRVTNGSNANSCRDNEIVYINGVG